MSTVMRGVRGATTVEADDAGMITERVQELVTAMVERNDVDRADIASIFFSATGDLSAKYPATAARELGYGDVPLFGMRELDVVDMMPRCIRVLIHWNTTKTNAEIHHVFQHGAQSLRADLTK